MSGQTSNPEHLIKGQAAEQAALALLKENQCELIAQNYYSRHGEIDLIVLHNDVLVFVEVRYRKDGAFGGAIESITGKKQASIKMTAEHFLQKNPDLNFRGCRFDVFLLSGNAPDYQYDWIEAAF